ncbi:hypothetical protein [Tsukamurella tyrosinosolvens]|uniref:hypothetical protein n=1 Tax=Tsukamurella tyrosinosolvens TaxID=57704 RepID=UPI002DD438B1|nr:hypothetical protein [Tsukamurella tyrosinosolvens]MEC4615508.1 hypothetical protein [Tsukamurella tyrosinosolvens]
MDNSSAYTTRTLPGVAWPGGQGWPAHAADPAIGYIEIDASGTDAGPFGYVRVTSADSDERLVMASQAAADTLGIPSGETIFGMATWMRGVMRDGAA